MTWNAETCWQTNEAGKGSGVLLLSPASLHTRRLNLLPLLALEKGLYVSFVTKLSVGEYTF